MAKLNTNEIIMAKIKILKIIMARLTTKPQRVYFFVSSD
jgi:hypothetical protein